MSSKDTIKMAMRAEAVAHKYGANLLAINEKALDQAIQFYQWEDREAGEHSGVLVLAEMFRLFLLSEPSDFAEFKND